MKASDLRRGDSAQRAHRARQEQITRACHQHITEAKAVWAAVVERTGIQSAVNWPAEEIEKFLADVARLVREAKHESDSH